MQKYQVVASRRKFLKNKKRKKGNFLRAYRFQNKAAKANTIATMTAARIA
jgi:hypothetical protein